MSYSSLLVHPTRKLCINITGNEPFDDNKEFENFHWCTFERHPGRKWHSLELCFRLDSFTISHFWDESLSEVEWYMYEHNEGGGLAGVDPEYHRQKENLIRRGREIMKAQSMQEEIESESARDSSTRESGS